MLFVMDACYGGLVFTRSLAPGSMRFLKDMLLRYSRQVLTAGKADEVVADSGGPVSGHSIFTGYFIEALKDKAAKDAFQELTRQEQGHQNWLGQYLRGELKEGAISSGQAIDYRIAERFDQPEISPDMRLKNAFLLATNREKSLISYSENLDKFYSK